ncbi:MAG: PhoPQ-activated pathogenicity-related family protein [Gammaproteobacteria bacterium]
MTIALPAKMRRFAFVAVAVLAAGTASAEAPPDDALASYVAAPDETFSWHVRARHTLPGAEIVELRLHSQTWRGTLWKHRLHLILPDNLDPDLRQAVLVIGGGRWRESYDGAASQPLDDDAALFVAIAARLESVVAVVEQVPFQPIFGLREDDLIAHTFEQYLATGEPDWPLLLPMVKAAVRAMDAVQAFAASDWQVDIDRFTVAGASKRGWTTWLTGATDPRAALLVPIVIDVLNFERHLPHQRAMWGVPSEQIAPYTSRGLDDVLSSAQGEALRRIVDPYSYRERLTQPKLIVIATNDAYFPVDSLNLYWSSLVGPKNVLYLPNQDHDAEDFARLIPALDAMHRLTATGQHAPTLESTLANRPGRNLRLCIRTTPAPIAVAIWSADSEDPDFRDETFTPAPVGRDGDAFVAEIEPPSGGFRAFFAEALLDGPNGPYLLSTTVRVIGRDGAPPAFAAPADEHAKACA